MQQVKINKYFSRRLWQRANKLWSAFWCDFVRASFGSWAC